MNAEFRLVSQSGWGIRSGWNRVQAAQLVEERQSALLHQAASGRCVLLLEAGPAGAVPGRRGIRRSTTFPFPPPWRRSWVPGVIRDPPPTKEKLLEAAQVLCHVDVQAPVHTGDVVLPDLCGTGVDLVAARTILS